jgi:hypothetical protein
MVERRHMLGGGILGGLLGVLGGETASAAAPAQGAEQSRLEAAQVARAIDQLRQQIHTDRMFTELAPIRELQLKYLVGNGKFPDFLEVGTDVWFGVHDWHIRWNQPLNIGRDVQNRPTITLMQTTIILRPEMRDYIGIPYDNK